ncbi:tail fiber domain-containing protein [Paenibacillus sp. J2TS4]|uniref:tail fiber domain-containing protein n=1 Tax=Paenibacillus sp. J2TS4 TaxID=2807194 RepID=UPI001B0A3D1D|nr:tail fiber domain-containing protein [Paenibacillus sp. J2TS4]GIP33633.1 hypothetical protein J2TS4_28430 [Paenibacillus sp. J2TS4]
MDNQTSKNKEFRQKNEVDKEANLKQEEGGKISRRQLMATMGLAGAAVVSGGLFSTLSNQAFAAEKERKDPITDDADRISYSYSEDQIKRTVADKLREFVSVKDFGAKGDGVADDTEAFIAAETKAKGKFIYVPPGTYNAYEQHLSGNYFGKGAVVIFRTPETFYNTMPDSEKTYQWEVELGAIPQPVLNEFYGKSSGTKSQAEAYTNTAVGEESLKTLTTGKQNTAVGFRSQSENKTQYSNVSLGSDSLSKGDFFSRSVAVGSNAMKWAGTQDPIIARHELWLDEHDVRDPWSVPGSTSYFLLEMNPEVADLIKPGGLFPKASSAEEVMGNVGVGRNALLQLVKGRFNTAFGYQALSRSYTTERSVALGAYALSNSLAGYDNIGIGMYALRFNQTGNRNTVIGYDAAYSDVFADRNVIIGYRALRDAKGDKSPSNTLNTIIGTFAGQNKTNGMANVAIGARTLLNGQAGSRNVVVGTEAAQNYTGNNSIIIGNNAEPTTQQDRVLWVDYGNDRRSSPFIYGDMGNDIMNVRANLRPDKDASQSLGAPSRRWDSLYAQNGTINTSDERHKQQISAIPDEWLDAWEEVDYCRFKFNDAVEEKGEKARWHVGIIAQRVHEVFQKRGLNAFEIGLLCYDKWKEERVDVLDQEGKSTGKTQISAKEGDLWSIRADECQFMEMALMRRELKKLKAAR